MAKKPGSDLLIDRLFQQSFLPDPELRNPDLVSQLRRARRMVLSDEMTAFLVDMTFQAFHARALRKHHAEPDYTRLFKLLDSMRHFSRLPHQITWIEYSHQAFIKRNAEIRAKHNLELIMPGVVLTTNPEDHGKPAPRSPEELVERAKGQRFGWLLQQDDRIDTAFTCSVFSLADPRDIVRLAYSALAWDADNTPTLERLIEPTGHARYKSGSELATRIDGYIRSNVGYASRMTQRPDTDEADYDAEMRELMPNVAGTLRYVWTFLSTVNKIPLQGEREIKASRGFMARGTYHRYLDHKLVTLHVPQKADPVKLAKKVLGDVIRRRAHQVRGHFRDDWRKPKGNKDIWVPEHVRGDDRKGFVMHDYVVKHGDE